VQIYNFPPGAIFLAGGLADLDVTTTSETLDIEGTLTIYWAVLGDY